MTIIIPIEAYPKLLNGLKELSEIERTSHLRNLCRTNLYFLLRYALNRPDVEHPWLYARCNEVQENPNEYLDLWSREHYKSTIITFAKSIQDILASHGEDPLPEFGNREVTLGIFSFNRGIALDFVSQIKNELENNKFLKYLFPDILYPEPERQSPQWSVQGGINVIRQSNPKESTLEGWGLVDSMPTGRHFVGRIYDDVITERYARSPEMIAKSTESWELSLNLGSRGGYSRYVGTRYNYNDTYRAIMQREAATPRLYPATDDGTITGNPVLLTPEELAKKRREMGPYTFGCHVAMTLVLMADGSQKPIADIRVGDKVIGFEKAAKTRLVETEVLAVKSRKAPVVRICMESGREVISTPDHKWWAGRWREKNSYNYADRLKGLCSVISVRPCPDERAAAYMAGIFDGEGCLSGGSIHIHQSEPHNPAVCQAIRDNLARLGFQWGEHTPAGRNGCIDFYLTGGRQAMYDFLIWCKPVKRPENIMKAILKSRNIGYKGARDNITAVYDEGEDTVYNIQTGTGNYIADGYASKNCQMMQDPKADEVQGLKKEWMRFYKRDEFSPRGMNLYLLCDPASEKKKTSDYTAMAVVGIGPDGNKYLVDLLRDRLNLTERTRALMRFHRTYAPKQVGYEKYGKDSDIEHIESVQNSENYRFEIIQLGGTMHKNDRIRRIIPDMESGIWYFPDHIHVTDYEGKDHDLIEDLINDEIDPFPVGTHDDMLDVISRIYDEDIDLITPKPVERQDAYHKRRKRSPWVR